MEVLRAVWWAFLKVDDSADYSASGWVAKMANSRAVLMDVSLV